MPQTWVVHSGKTDSDNAFHPLSRSQPHAHKYFNHKTIVLAENTESFLSLMIHVSHTGKQLTPEATDSLFSFCSGFDAVGSALLIYSV